MDTMTGQAVAAAGALIPTGATTGNNMGNQFISNYNFDTINIREQIDVFSIPDWQFLDDTYTGQGGYKSGKYLVPHPRETAYNRRRQLSVYRNYFKKIVNAKVAPIFNEKIARETEDEMFLEFLKDVDNNGTDINEYMKRISIDSVVKGVAFIVMDTFREGDMPDTVDEASENRAFPYIYMKTKGDVAAYELNDFGNIVSITFNDKDVKVEKKTEKRYRMWTAEFSQIMKYDLKNRVYVPVEPPVMHNLGMVPVYPFATSKRDNDELLPASELWDIAKICWSLYGIDSEIRQQVRDQCFSVFYYQGDNGSMATLGTANALALPQDTKIPPGFAQPDPQTLAQNIAYADGIHSAMLELAEQQGVTGVAKQLSGEAKAWDFQANNETLKTLALLAKEAEEWIYKCFSTYVVNTEECDYSPKYREDYTPHGYTEDLKMLQQGLDNNISPKTNVELKKEMVSIIFSTKEPEDLQELYDDIDIENKALEEAKVAAKQAAKEMALNGEMIEENDGVETPEMPETK